MKNPADWRGRSAVGDLDNPDNSTSKPAVATHHHLAERLAGIRAEITVLTSAPYQYGISGPHRRRRDVDILLSFGADLNARLIAARAGQ